MWRHCWQSLLPWTPSSSGNSLPVADCASAKFSGRCHWKCKCPMWTHRQLTSSRVVASVDVWGLKLKSCVTAWGQLLLQAVLPPWWGSRPWIQARVPHRASVLECNVSTMRTGTFGVFPAVTWPTVPVTQTSSQWPCVFSAHPAAICCSLTTAPSFTFGEPPCSPVALVRIWITCPGSWPS
jgi:hypothetical protein